MRFDWTTNLGTIIQILTMIGLVVGLMNSLKSRLDAMQAMLKTHADALAKHDVVLSVYETRIFTMVADIQKLIGKFEMVASQTFQSSKES